MSCAANFPLTSAATRTDLGKRRRRALERVDSELSKGNFKTALSLVKQLQRKPAGLRAFGTAGQVPKRVSSPDNLKLSGMDLSSLQPLVDSVMDSIQRCIQFALLEEVSVENSETLIHHIDNDRNLYIQHEAGHFLVGYLLGVLPRGYKIPSLEDLRHDKFAAGRVEFVGFEFLKEVGRARMLRKDIVTGLGYNMVNRGKISCKTLSNFLCVILGGLVTEHILFGYSEGLHSDVDKLDSVLTWLGYTKSEADFQVRWAALNTAFILDQHSEARAKLAEAMALGRSVGSCINTIEHAILGKEM